MSKPSISSSSFTLNPIVFFTNNVINHVATKHHNPTAMTPIDCVINCSPIVFSDKPRPPNANDPKGAVNNIPRTPPLLCCQDPLQRG